MKDKTHGFDGKMDDGAMGAIAMFVTKGQVDMDKFIDRKSKKAMGDTTKGKAYYVTLCANCHGADGKLPKDLEAPLGKEQMPALRALPHQVSADVLAYLQTLPQK
jgi:mono/diheme cytochrome c family protein